MEINRFIKKISPLFSLLSSLATIGIALFAVKISVNQLDAGNTTSAKSIYKDYLNLALAHPRYASASYPLWSPRYSKFRYGSEESEAYEFFVSLLLLSTEEILSIPGKDGWLATLETQLSYHALYLNSDEFNPRMYSCEVRDLIVAGIALYSEQQYKYGQLLDKIQPSATIPCTSSE